MLHRYIFRKKGVEFNGWLYNNLYSIAPLSCQLISSCYYPDWFPSLYFLVVFGFWSTVVVLMHLVLYLSLMLENHIDSCTFRQFGLHSVENWKVEDFEIENHFKDWKLSVIILIAVWTQSLRRNVNLEKVMIWKHSHISAYLHYQVSHTKLKIHHFPQKSPPKEEKCYFNFF